MTENSKIIILAELTINPEHLEESKVLFKELEEKSAAEKDCEFYSVKQDSNNENVFVIYEIFTNKEAHEFHKTTEHYLDILKIKLSEYIISKNVKFLK